MRYLLASVCQAAVFLTVTCSQIHFDVGYVYRYTYSSTLTLEEVDEFKILAKVEFVNIAPRGDKEELYLKIADYRFSPSNRDDIIGHDMDIGNWFSFVISNKGVISEVFYPANETSDVVTLKKGLSSLLSGIYLHANERDDTVNVRGGWRYNTEEVGHEGNHNATYIVVPTAAGRMYTKMRVGYQHPVSHASSDMKKTVHIDDTLGTVHTVTVSEELNIRHTTKDGFNPYHGMRKVEPVNTFENVEYPSMKASSNGKLTFVDKVKAVNIPVKPIEIQTSSIHHSDNDRTSGRSSNTRRNQNNSTAAFLFIQTNLTCIRQQPKKGSKELLDCVSNLVYSLMTVPDHELEKIVDLYFNQKLAVLEKDKDDQNAILDAMCMMETSKSQQLLAQYVLMNPNVNRKLRHRLLYHISSAKRSPHTAILSFFDMLVNKSEYEIYNSYDVETVHIMLLTLGAVCHTLQENGDTDLALKFTAKVKDMLGYHDPWLYRQKRSTMIDEEQTTYDLRRVVLLEALGNGRHTSSFEHIVSHLNSTNSPWIKRSAVHALRHFHHPQAADAILEAAVYDNNEEVRYEAMLQYQAHPLSVDLNTSTADRYNGSRSEAILHEQLYDITVLDDSTRFRSRRGILDEGIEWRLDAPSVDWRLPIGSSDIGGSFGVVMINYLDLKIALLSGRFTIVVHDEVYARVHLGVIDKNIDFFMAKVCFKGEAKYNFNILKEFDPRLGAETLELLTEGLKDVITGLKTGVDSITDIINGGVFKATIEDFLQAFRELPERVLELRQTAFSAMRDLGELIIENLPPFIKPVQELVVYVTNLFNDINSDVLNFYNMLVQAIETVIPNAAKQIFTSISGIIDELPNIFKDPKTSVARIGKGVVSIIFAVKELQRIKKTVADSIFIADEKPYWMDIAAEYENVADLAGNASKAVREQGRQWVDIATESDDSISLLTAGAISERDIRDRILTKVDGIISTLTKPFNDLKELGNGFGEQFIKLFELVSDIKGGYNKLKLGYQDARALIDKVFGPKCHKDFPNLLRDIDECAYTGFFPAKLGGGHEYRHKGVDLVIKENAKVMAPLSGIAVLTGHDNEVMIMNITELPTGHEIIIMNVEPNSDIYSLEDAYYTEKWVTAGDDIGVATKSRCTNHIHFVLLKNGGVVDPSRLLAPRPLEIPEWKQFCDDYKVVFAGMTLTAGVIVGNGVNKDDTSGSLSDDGTQTEAIDNSQEPSEAQGGGIFDSMTGNNRKRRKRNDFLDKTSKYSERKKKRIMVTKLDALIERTAAFLDRYSIRRIKMGAIVELINKLGMEESKKQMAVVMKRIKDVIDDPLCTTPAQMTNEEIRIQLRNKGFVPPGSREHMIRTLMTADKSCPYIAMGIPVSENMYCSFDAACLGVQCCLTLTVIDLYQKSYSAFIRLIPEDLQLNIGFGDWKREFKFLERFEYIEDQLSTGVTFDLFDLEVICSYKIDKSETEILVTFGCGLCSISDNDVCLLFVFLVEDAIFPIPKVDANGILTWPDVDFDNYFKIENVKNRFSEAGEDLLERGKEVLVGELLSALGIQTEYLKNNVRCPIPENLLHAELVDVLAKRSLSTDGTRSEQEQRLRLADRTCTSSTGSVLTLPSIEDSTFKDIFYYHVSKQCLRFDACLDVTLPGINITKTFTATVELDPCNFKLNISIEKWKKSIWLVEYSWGVESQLKLSDNVYMRYTIGKDDATKELIISVGLSCISVAFDQMFVSSQRIPIPVCNGDFKLPGAGDLRSFAESIGGEITQESFSVYASLSGLDAILNIDTCELTKEPTKDCNTEVSEFIPDILSDIVHCKMVDNCWGVSCCLNFSFHIPLSSTEMTVSFPFMIKYDPCEYFVEVQIGPKHLVKQWFVDYSWGETNVITFAKGTSPPVNITFVVNKFEKGFTIDATLNVCLPVGEDILCIPEGRPLNLLKNEHIPLCYLGLDNVEENYPDFSLNDWLEERWRELGDEIGEAGRNYIFEKLNITDLFLEHSCDRKRAPYSPSVDGWNIACSKSHVNLLAMPKSASCHVAKDCQTISCCIDVPYFDIGVKVDIQLNLCENVVVAGIEKAFERFDDALSTYEWGTLKTVSVGKVLTARYKIEKPATDSYVIGLSLAACFENNGDCLLNISIFEGLEIPRIYCKDVIDTCARSVENITHQCAMDADCQGITCDVIVNDDMPPIMTYVRIDKCTDQLIYNIGRKKWTISLSAVNDGSLQLQEINNDISMKYTLEESANSYYVSVNLSVCGTYVVSNICKTVEILSDIQFHKSSCDQGLRRKRSIDIPGNIDFKDGLKELVKRHASDNDISQYLKNVKDYQNAAKEAALFVSNIDDNDLDISNSGAVNALGANNPLTIPHTQASTWKSSWDLDIPGADALLDLMSDIDTTIGTGEQLFVIGQGLTSKGVILLTRQLANMTIGDLEALLELNRVDPTIIHQMTMDLIELATVLYSETMEKMTTGALQNAFESYDLTARGDFSLPRMTGSLFYTWIPFPLGPVLLKFEFGVDYYYGIRFGVGVRVLGMVGETSATPYGGLKVWGSLSVGFFLRASLELVGYIMRIQFPTIAEVGFSKFPLDVGLRMNLKMVPLTLKLNGLVTFSYEIPFVGEREKIIFKKTIWSYSSPPICKEMFNNIKEEKDESPPVFSDVVISSNKKRSVTGTQHCEVEQLPDRDYTEPAFQILVAAVDDKSQLRFFLDVGTTPGGTDTLNEFQLGGALTKLSMKLNHTGVPLFFTMHAQNSQGTRASVTCQLSSYDITVPSGRLKSDFDTSSNPSFLRVSILAHDESPLNKTNLAIGYGEGVYGDQIYYWHEVNLEKRDHSVEEGNILNHFAGGIDGRLIGGVLMSLPRTLRVKKCAQLCLDLPEHSCLSFNFDYGESGECELLKAIEGHDNSIAKDGHFSHYERLRIGNAVEVEKIGLSLQHNHLYEFNLDMTNSLGYRNIITTKGILIDLTPPEPGYISNTKDDYLEFVPCLKMIPLDDRPKWERYCVGVDNSIMNHRVVIDGAGSLTVFNGNEAMTDMKYTRANTFITANWDGFHDNETSIRGYTWAIGKAYCEDMIHPHVDPHRHALSKNHWNYMGEIFPIPAPYTILSDGAYYVTVRALNSVEFGGPLTLSVCHTTPYVVDNSPPLVNELYNIQYDERSYFVYADIKISDPHSDISEYDICLGETSLSCDILPWHRYDYNLQPSVSHHFKIPDGLPAWLRIRAVNNVQLTTVDSADQAIMVDSTAPIAGQVNDGPLYNTDLQYSKDKEKICVNWLGFYDPDSGISSYFVGIGKSPGKTDVVPLTAINYQNHAICLSVADNTNLMHGKTYFAVVWAINGGIMKRNVSAVSDGVTIDLTPPDEGELVDGNETEFADMTFSPSKSTVSLQWKNYSDSESGVRDYAVQVSNKIGESNIVIQQWTSFPKDTESASWMNFHLKHNDYIISSLNITNGALNNITSTTNGFLVDLTAPELKFIGDGTLKGMDIRFQNSTDELSVNFDIVDHDSGLESFRFQVFEKIHGIKQQIFPDSVEEWFEQTDVERTIFIKKNLTLQQGALYTTRVGATNKAGIVGTYETTGVILDDSKPEIRWLHVGVLFGEIEDKHDGFVYQSDHHGIKVSWLAFDQESGIETILVSVGTSQDSADTKPSTEYSGDIRDLYVTDIELQDSNTTSEPMAPVYYVTLVAVNGAGLHSDRFVSTPILIVPEDVPGIVIDGITTEENIFHHDIDYQADTTTVSVSFEGFSSSLHGISSFVWGIGTTPDSEDIQPFSEYGITDLEEADTSESGVSYSGFGQTSVPLDPGQHYYTTVRGITNNGHVLSTVSDGFTVDTTPPNVVIDRLLDVDLANKMEFGSIYSADAAFLQAIWHYYDSEIISSEILDNIDTTWYSVGTFPFGSDITNVTQQHVTTIYKGGTEDKSFVLSHSGKPNILTVNVRNKAGLLASVYAPAVVIDTTSPREGTVSCLSYAQPNIPIRCTWTPFLDDESPIVRHEYCLGTTPGDNDVLSFVSLPGDADAYLFDEYTIIPEHGQVYYATVTAYNSVGKTASSFSGPINIDTTPPVPGTVIELSHQNVYGNGHSGNRNTQCTNDSDCLQFDVVCQESFSSVSVAWQPFVDIESDIKEYYMAVGSTEGGTEVIDYFLLTPFPVDTVYSLYRLNLVGLQKIYVKILAVNGVGLSSVSISNGVYLSYLSQGISPLSHVGIWDADPAVEGDIYYQSDPSQLHAGWDVSGDPCPAVRYEWAIERIDGMLMQNFTEMTGLNGGTNDQLTMLHGETFYSLLRVTNALGYTYILRSNGVTIDNQPLAPGMVFDGDIFGYDLNVLPSRAIVTCNWANFGVSKTTSAEDVITGNKGVPNDSSNTQEVSHYEVALGTDRRFSATRADIVGLTNVGTNTSHTFKGLSLVPGIGKYYCTVKAYSKSFSTAEVTSNGFAVTFNGGVKAGGIKISEFVTSNTSLDIQWEGFTSEEGLMLYYVAVADHDEAQDLDCKQVVDGGTMSDDKKAELFNIVTVTNVGINTYKQLVDLQLKHGHMFYVFVIGVDYAGECNMTMNTTTLDLTEPVGGAVTGGPYFNMGVTFTADQTAITVKWDGYMDNESGINLYVVSLWFGTSCQDDVIQGQIGTNITLKSDAKEFTFRDLILERSIPYFVKLIVINGAGSSRSQITSPILFDDSLPRPGRVVEGSDFKSNVVWWGSTSHVTGTFLHYQSNKGTSCPSQAIAFTERTWSAIDGPLLTDPDGNLWNLIYSPRHIKIDERTGELVIQMSRDFKSLNMLSGAFSRNANFEDEGTYEISLKAVSGDERSVTEILLLDTEMKQFQTHNYNESSDWTTELCSCCINPSTDFECPCSDCEAYTANLNASLPDENYDFNTLQNITVGDDDQSVNYIKQSSCGFQIYSGKLPYSVTWCRFHDTKIPVMRISSNLNFDPSSFFHTYRLEFVTTKEDLQPNMCIRTYVDGEELSYLCGIPKLSSSTNFLLHVWNSDSFLPEITNDLDSWSVFAAFRNVIFPPAIGELCRYGKPFRAGNTSIVRYEAGIGSRKGDIDVHPFKEVLSPCLPCTSQCSRYDCDDTCENYKATQLEFTLDNLDLKPLSVENNDTSLNVFYITVKAVLASGLSVTSSSDGFYVDVTPPVFDKDVLLYIDVDQGEFTPVEYQGSNNTIKVIWLCNDEESEVQKYEWAIGTSKGREDVQSYMSTGDNPSGINKKLEDVLIHKGRYYASVKCTNGAGLTTIYQDDKGLEVLLEVPDPDDMSGQIEGAEAFAYAVDPSNAMKSSNPTSVGCSWTIASDPGIKRYDFCCGSSETNIDDIFPCTWVGYNASGEVKIENGYLFYNGEQMYSINKLRQDINTDLSTSGSFLMEPGRVIFVSIRICNEARKCGIKHLGTVTVMNDHTQAVVSDGHSPLKFTFTAVGPGRVRKRDLADIAIDLKIPGDLPIGQTVMLSQLTYDDLTADYRSDASLDFVPYIVNPVATTNKTERLLRDRLHTFVTSFVVSPVGHLVMTGPLLLTYTWMNTLPQEGIVNMIVHWNPVSQQWKMTSRTCLLETDTETRDSSTGTTTVKICNTRSSVDASLDEQYYGTETQFAIFAVKSQVQNNAPVFKSDMKLTMNEDKGVMTTVLSATDKDGDDVGFRLIQYNAAFTVDEVSVSEHGSLRFSPCKHCHGTATIDIEMYDISKYGDITSASSYITITVNITSVNDPPTVFLIDEEGNSLLFEDISEEIKIYRDNKEGKQVTFSAIFGAYDYDKGDELMVIHVNSGVLQGMFFMEVLDKSYDDFVTCNNTWCFGDRLEASPLQMSWLFGRVTYHTNASFTGVDRVKMVVRDAMGTFSDLVTVAVYNLEDPCLNGGYCGTSTGHPCDDPVRLNDFDKNYVCVCASGWSGSHCQYDVDECLSYPCSKLTTCQNTDGSYKCVYALYFIIPVSIGAVIVLMLIILLVIRYRKKCRKLFSWNPPSTDGFGNHIYGLGGNERIRVEGGRGHTDESPRYQEDDGYDLVVFRDIDGELGGDQEDGGHNDSQNTDQHNAGYFSHSDEGRDPIEIFNNTHMEDDQGLSIND